MLSVRYAIVFSLLGLITCIDCSHRCFHKRFDIQANDKTKQRMEASRNDEDDITSTNTDLKFKRRPPKIRVGDDGVDAMGIYEDEDPLDDFDRKAKRFWGPIRVPGVGSNNRGKKKKWCLCERK